MTSFRLFDLAFAAHQAGRLDEAARLYELALEEDPNHFDAMQLLGAVLLQRGEYERAASQLERALLRDASQTTARVNLGLALIALGRHAEAEAQLRRVVETTPNSAAAHDHLGTALRHQGRHAEAVASHERAAALEPKSAAVHHNLGLARRAARDLAGAADAFRRAAELDPSLTVAVVALAETVASLGDHEEAAALYERALARRPDDAALHAALGDALHSMERLDDAVVTYRRAVARDPALVDAWWGLGCALQSRNDHVEAIAAFEALVARAPDAGVAWHNLGKSRYALGLVDAARDALERALAFLGPNENTLGVLATIVPGAHDADPAAILATRRRWAALQVAGPRPDVGRRDGPLRVGYVSSFFQDRNWMKPVWALVNRHDRARFEIHLFSDAPASAIRSGYRADARDHVHDVSGLGDEAVANRIRSVPIDVLVDLNGFSQARRLALFARRPAPVQVAWFNHYATTGLDCFDALVADDYVAPPGEEAFCSEPIVRLPCSYLTFFVDYEVPDVAQPPCATRGRFAFGCLAPQYKLTPRFLAACARILRGSPDATLILRNRLLATASVREHVASVFQAAGVDASRLDLRGPAEHFAFLETYDDVDLALDTFPYNGGTTTMEALWQGVPVVTFAGDRWASRIGASLMRNAALAEFVADDEAGFVAAAVRAASSSDVRARLAEFRASARERLRASSVCDAATLCRSMEDLYVRLCDG